VSAVLLAPPNAGNAVFAAAFDVAVNGRRVSFVYDPVPQVPCKGFYGCSAKQVPLETGPVDGVPPWPYATIGGTVKLTPAAMGPQATYWGGLDRINLCYMLQQLGAAHMCAYACATAPFAAGVTDTQCLLRPAAAGELAANSYCNSPPVQGKPDGWPQAAFPPAGKVW
jgi:hypothetical protein